MSGVVSSVITPDSREIIPKGDVTVAELAEIESKVERTRKDLYFGGKLPRFTDGKQEYKGHRHNETTRTNEYQNLARVLDEDKANLLIFD